MAFTDEIHAEAREIIARYPPGRARSALLPLLHLVQSQEGYVSADGIAFCAGLLGLTAAETAAVSTFYTMFKRHPTGEYLVSVCTNTMCGVLGGDHIFAALREQLGVGHDETTADGRFTLEHAECLAACDYAPVVTVNYEYFDRQTPASAAALVTELATGARPHPTRGAPLCSFREMSHQLAGFADARDGAVPGRMADAETRIGLTVAAERGEAAPAMVAAAGPQDAASESAPPTAPPTPAGRPGRKEA